MARVRIVSLTYHDVAEGDEASGFRTDIARPYQLSLSQFVAHLNVIEQGPLRPGTVFDLPLDGDALLLTFDDGG